MSNPEPNIWTKRQALFDRFFPVIAGLLIINLGILSVLIVKEYNRSPNQSKVAEQQLPSMSVTPSLYTTESAGIINLRVATLNDLDRLPGIGPKKAEQIILLRDEGKITSVADLRKVKGIGDKLYNEIKDQLIWE